MKILYLTLENISLHKGSVVHIKEIVKGLQRMGYPVGLMAVASNPLNHAEHFYNLHPAAFRLLSFLDRKKKYYFLSSLLLFFYLFKILPQYDLLYARDYHTVLIALCPRLIFRKKLVFEMNGLANEEQQLKGHSLLNRVIRVGIRKAEKKASQWSDRIVVVTPLMASYLHLKFNCHPEKVEVVSNGVNTKLFYPILDEAPLINLRKKWGIGEKETVVLFAGNLAPWQGIENLIRVAPSVIKTHENVKFLIIGDGRLKKALEMEVERLNVSEHFIFTGMVEYAQIPSYINIADICLVLKRRLMSGYSPIKLYEYMACGKPVLASRVDGLEWIEEEGIGLLSEPDHLKSLEASLNQLIHDPKKRSEMGKKGARIAREQFDWDLIVKRVGSLLEEMMG